MPERFSGLVELAEQIAGESDAPQSSDQWLHEIFERTESVEGLVTTKMGRLPEAREIYDALVYQDGSMLGERLGQNFEIVALPGEKLNASIQMGDVAIRKIDTESARVSVIASDQLRNSESARSLGWRLDRVGGDGEFAQVVEALGRSQATRRATQLTDGAGRILNDLLILRLATPPPTGPTVINVQQPAKDFTPGSDIGEFSESAESETDASILAAATREISLQGIADGALGKVPADILANILTQGENDAGDLANQIFWQRHPELSGQKLSNKDPKQQNLRMEWSIIFRRHVKPLVWLRAMVNEMDRYRGSLPRDFLLGWVAWESDGFLQSTTSLGELGYFQIMWQGGEAQSQLRLTKDEFAKLASDPGFSLEKGIALAEAYRQYILKTYPTVRDNSELLWRLTKARHAASGVLKNTLDRLTRSSITWPSVAKLLPAWMVENIDHTLSYAAKLKPLADMVPPTVPQTSAPSSGWSRSLRGGSEASPRLVLDFEIGELQEDSGVCPPQVDEVIYGWGQYKDDVDALPSVEKDKIERLANLVVDSFAVPGCAPLGQIKIVGHADHDVHGASLEKKVSGERALSVAAQLAKAIMRIWKARGMAPLTKGAISFDPSPHGVGATVPDASNVPVVTNRERNRRVAVTLLPFGKPNPLPPSPLPPKPKNPPGPPPEARTCCILAPSDSPLGPSDSNFAEPTKLGIHGSSSEVRGLVYSGKAGFVDLGHLRDLCDMTKNVFDQIAFAGAAAGTVVKTTHGEAVLATIPASGSVIAVARAICFDDSFGYEILTYGVNSPGAHNSSFSPEDLPSNFLGTLIAERAIAAGGKFEVAVSTEIDALLKSLDAQTKAETFRAFNLINHRWVDFKGVASLLSNDYLKRRNFTADPWKTGHPSDKATPAFMTAGFGITGALPYDYTNTTLRRIPKSSFAAELTAIRADAAKRYGPDFDKP